MVIDLFRQMRLPAKQVRTVAGIWHAWRDARGTLDHELSTALLPLTSLLGMPDIVLGCQPGAAGHVVRSVHSCGWLRGGGSSGEGGGGSGAVDGGQVCICELCAANMASRLLGGSGRSTASAQVAAARVSTVHQRDADLFVEVLRAVCMTGVLFSPEQLMRQTSLTLKDGALVDWLWLCKVAAEELEREEVIGGMQQSFGIV